MALKFMTLSAQLSVKIVPMSALLGYFLLFSTILFFFRLLMRAGYLPLLLLTGNSNINSNSRRATAMLLPGSHYMEFLDISSFGLTDWLTCNTKRPSYHLPPLPAPLFTRCCCRRLIFVLLLLVDTSAKMFRFILFRQQQQQHRESQVLLLSLQFITKRRRGGPFYQSCLLACVRSVRTCC